MCVVSAMLKTEEKDRRVGCRKTYVRTFCLRCIRVGCMFSTIILTEGLAIFDESSRKSVYFCRRRHVSDDQRAYHCAPPSDLHLFIRINQKERPDRAWFEDKVSAEYIRNEISGGTKRAYGWRGLSGSLLDGLIGAFGKENWE